MAKCDGSEGSDEDADHSNRCSGDTVKEVCRFKQCATEKRRHKERQVKANTLPQRAKICSLSNSRALCPLYGYGHSLLGTSPQKNLTIARFCLPGFFGHLEYFSCGASIQRLMAMDGIKWYKWDVESNNLVTNWSGHRMAGRRLSQVYSGSLTIPRPQNQHRPMRQWGISDSVSPSYCLSFTNWFLKNGSAGFASSAIWPVKRLNISPAFLTKKELHYLYGSDKSQLLPSGVVLIDCKSKSDATSEHQALVAIISSFNPGCYKWLYYKKSRSVTMWNEFCSLPTTNLKSIEEVIKLSSTAKGNAAARNLTPQENEIAKERGRTGAPNFSPEAVERIDPDLPVGDGKVAMNSCNSSDSFGKIFEPPTVLHEAGFVENCLPPPGDDDNESDVNEGEEEQRLPDSEEINYEWRLSTFPREFVSKYRFCPHYLARNGLYLHGDYFICSGCGAVRCLHILNIEEVHLLTFHGRNCVHGIILCRCHLEHLSELGLDDEEVCCRCGQKLRCKAIATSPTMEQQQPPVPRPDLAAKAFSELQCIICSSGIEIQQNQDICALCSGRTCQECDLLQAYHHHED